MELLKILESSMKIRFHDCDPFNHLNNSKYIDYIVVARGDQLLENYNLDIHQLAKTEGVGWVSAQTNISYILPACPNENVIIQTQLTGFSEKSLLVEGIMWNSNKTAVKAVMWIKLVHFHLHTQKSHRHSEHLMGLFGDIVSPLYPQVNFEERVKNLKTGI